MKPIELPASFRKTLRGLDREQRREIGRILQVVQQAYGHPHQHRGLGLRNLRGGFFEIRVGLDRRIILHDAGEALVCKFLGNHDEIRRFLKNL